MIARVLFAQDMRLGLPGLTQYVEDNRIKLKSTDMVLFMNSKQTMCKVLFDGQYLLTVKAKSGKLTMDEIHRIPSYFRGLFISVQQDSKLARHLDLTLERAAS